MTMSVRIRGESPLVGGGFNSSGGKNCNAMFQGEVAFLFTLNGRVEMSHITVGAEHSAFSVNLN